MTPPPSWGVPSPRATTAAFAVPARQATLAWTAPDARAATAPDPHLPDPGARRTAGERRKRRTAPSWAVAALVAAGVSAGTVGTLLTVGPLADRPDTVPVADAGAKAPTTRPDTGWQALAVSGGFIPTGDGARYRVVDGICYLQVHLRDPDGIWAAYSPIAVLPESARPAWNHGFVAVRDGVPFSEVGVYDDGQVLMTRPGDGVAGWLTLSASFPVGD